jgi:uncharacterized protein (DUF736 family)
MTLVKFSDIMIAHFMKGDKQMEVKPNTGMLMRNTRKESEKHPDFTGSWVDANGNEFFLDAWANVSAKGNKYMKLRLGKPKTAQPVSAHNVAKSNGYQPQAPLDDDIPF